MSAGRAPWGRPSVRFVEFSGTALERVRDEHPVRSLRKDGDWLAGGDGLSRPNCGVQVDVLFVEVVDFRVVVATRRSWHVGDGVAVAVVVPVTVGETDRESVGGCPVSRVLETAVDGHHDECSGDHKHDERCDGVRQPQPCPFAHARSMANSRGFRLEGFRFRATDPVVCRLGISKRRHHL